MGNHGACTCTCSQLECTCRYTYTIIHSFLSETTSRIFPVYTGYLGYNLYIISIHPLYSTYMYSVHQQKLRRGHTDSTLLYTVYIHVYTVEYYQCAPSSIFVDVHEYIIYTCTCFNERWERKEGMKKQARSSKQQGKPTQHTQGSHFFLKNELLWVGLEPMTLYTLDRALYHWATCTCTCTCTCTVHGEEESHDLRYYLAPEGTRLFFSTGVGM